MWLVSTYGRERLERQVRILNRPDGIARVDADADEFRAGRFDQHLQLARLHVAGVILDRDLDAGVHHLRARVLQHARPSTRCAARCRRGGRRCCRARRARSASGRSCAASTIRPSCSSAVPCALSNIGRRRADRAHADLEIEAQLVGARAHLAQVVRLEVAEEADLAEVDDLDLPLRGEIHLLERRPVLRAEAVHVDAEAHGCSCLLGQRGAGHGKRGGQGLQKIPTPWCCGGKCGFSQDSTSKLEWLTRYNRAGGRRKIGPGHCELGGTRRVATGQSLQEIRRTRGHNAVRLFVCIIARLPLDRATQAGTESTHLLASCALVRSQPAAAQPARGSYNTHGGVRDDQPIRAAAACWLCAGNHGSVRLAAARPAIAEPAALGV